MVFMDFKNNMIFVDVLEIIFTMILLHCDRERVFEIK